MLPTDRPTDTARCSRVSATNNHKINRFKILHKFMFNFFMFSLFHTFRFHSLFLAVSLSPYIYVPCFFYALFSIPSGKKKSDLISALPFLDNTLFTVYFVESNYPSLSPNGPNRKKCYREFSTLVKNSHPFSVQLPFQLPSFLSQSTLSLFQHCLRLRFGSQFSVGKKIMQYWFKIWVLKYHNRCPTETYTPLLDIP